MVARKLAEAWGDAGALDVMGLGYATPYLEAFRGPARRAVAAMPAAQGVEVWPAAGRSLSCLADEDALPFPNALFDRILVIHALEEADDPLELMREVWRVLAPAGRVIVAAANRRGVWCNAEVDAARATARPSPAASWRRWCATPSWSRWPGRGRCSRRRCSGPAGWADGFEQAGAAAVAGLLRPDPAGGGEADLRGQAARQARPVRVFAPGVLAPQPARKAPKTAGARGDRAHQGLEPRGRGPSLSLGADGFKGGANSMKMITAIVKPSRLDAVVEAVTEAGASGLTVTEVRGYGRQKGKTEIYRGAEYEVKLLPKVKLEIAVADDSAEAIVAADAGRRQHRQDRRRQGVRAGPGGGAPNPHRGARRGSYRRLILFALRASCLAWRGA